MFSRVLERLEVSALQEVKMFILRLALCPLSRESRAKRQRKGKWEADCTLTIWFNKDEPIG